MIALVGLRDQLVDLAVRDLRQNAIPFADGQQNRVQHGVHAAHDLRVRALEALWLAAFRELAILRRLGQPPHLSFQILHHGGHIVDSHFHLLVVALVGLRDELVDLARGDLSQNTIPLADGQQNGVQHLVDALNHLAMHAVEQCRLAALGQPPFLRRIHQPHDLLQYEHRIVFRQVRLGACPPVVGRLTCSMTVPAVSVAGAVKLPALANQCSRHEIHSSLALAFVHFPVPRLAAWSGRSTRLKLVESFP